MAGNGGKIGIWSLTLLNIAAVLSIVNYPDQAEYGYTIIFFVTAGALTFLIPVALAAAELASSWPHDGGLYYWGKLAFGPRAGFFTLLLQFCNTLPLFSVILTFVASVLAYCIDPKLAGSPWFVYSVIVVLLWLCTFVGMRGVRFYALYSGSGALIGTIIPTLVLMAAALAYFRSGAEPAIRFTPRALLPDLSSPEQWMFLAGIMVSLGGLDMTALHITEIYHPRASYPRAVMLSALLIVLLSIGGAMSIALVVPAGELSTAAGVPEAMTLIFDKLNWGWLKIPFAIMLIAGGVGTVVAWVLGPARGLLQVAEDGYLPKFFTKCNRNGIPGRILILQAVLAGIIALAVFVMPSISSAFWFLMAMTAQIYMTMYIMLFASVLVLRYRQPGKVRPFRVPGGNIGMWIMALAGILSALTAMLAGYIPQQSVRMRGLWPSVGYSATLLLFVLLVFGTLFFIVRRAVKK